MAATDMLVGLQAWNAAPDQIARAIESGTHDVAQASTGRIADGIRARVHVHLQGRLRSAVHVVEESGAKQFDVGFDDQALIASGLPAMTPIWHEFGTVHMQANPAVGDSYAAEKPRYEHDMEAVITRVLDEASR